MLYIDNTILLYKLGNHVYHAKGCNRFVLADTKQQVQQIIGALALEWGEIERVDTLNEASTASHLNGERITLRHGSKTYNCDTLLAVGVPKSIDTSKPLKFIYKKSVDDLS